LLTAGRQRRQQPTGSGKKRLLAATPVRSTAPTARRSVDYLANFTQIAKQKSQKKLAIALFF
jgi:hypothetical protein